jgi:hypothetical protein
VYENDDRRAEAPASAAADSHSYIWSVEKMCLEVPQEAGEELIFFSDDEKEIVAHHLQSTDAKQSSDSCVIPDGKIDQLETKKKLRR